MSRRLRRSKVQGLDAVGDDAVGEAAGAVVTDPFPLAEAPLEFAGPV